MITIDQERPQDSSAIETLLDVALGPQRAQKSSAILRGKSSVLSGGAFVARQDTRLVGTVRLTPVHVHDPLFDRHRNALLLGPLAVNPQMQSMGVGRKLMKRALAAADEFDVDRVMLVGDIDYYARFGFEPVRPRVITMPGGKDVSRLLVRQSPHVAPLPILGTVEPDWVDDKVCVPVLAPAA